VLLRSERFPGRIYIAAIQFVLLPMLGHAALGDAGRRSGGTAFALFYRALSQGNMGRAAPVSTVLGAAIPAAFAVITTEGLPHPISIAGYWTAKWAKSAERMDGASSIKVHMGSNQQDK